MQTGTDIAGRVEGLPMLIERAATALASATTAAEVLDAKHLAGMAYTAANETARIAKKMEAYETVVAECHRAMGNALIIGHQAACRIADEYDEAQKRGEVAGPGGTGSNQYGNIQVDNISASVGDIGLTSVLVYEARLQRDAEKREPGIVERTVEAKLAAKEAPTKADVKRAITPKPKPQTERAPPPEVRAAPAPEQAQPPASEGYEEAREYLGVPEDRMPDALRQTPLGRAMMRYMEARSVIDWYFEGVARGRGIPWGEEYRDNRDDEFEAEELLLDQMMLALGLWQPSKETRHALDLLDDLMKKSEG